ncbi:MAG: hypothetical protein K6C14_08840 [Eubacterium sp.]|nr:hypothetical protein [Eubacterium sp.]
MKLLYNYDKEYQTFEGFGASGAWWAQEVGGWSDTRDDISRLLFSKTDGIGLRTYRYNLGAGSKESGKGNIENPLRRTESFETRDGDYDFTKDSNAVYMMKQAVKDGADEVILFANSPIERLTSNGLSHCTKSWIFKENLDKKNYGEFAKYVLDVTEHFINDGIPVKYISPINEPLWKWTGGQEGCHYRPKSAGAVMRVFAEELRKREVLSGVKLSGLENGDIRWFNKSYTESLMKYECVRESVDGVDLHSYFLKPVNLPFLKRTDYLRRYRKWLDKKYPDINVKISEWTHMKGGRDYGMKSALVTAETIFEDISVLNVTSWQHWIAVSEVDYCDGLIYINLSDKSFETTKRYYATGNFSKFIPYGAVRFEADTNDKALKTLGFKKVGEVIIVTINTSNTDVQLTLPEKNAVQYVTDKTDDLKEYKIGNGIADIRAKSVNTIIFRGNRI